MRPASLAPLIRRRKTESANSCVGEGFFSKLLEALQAWKDSADFAAIYAIGKKYAKFNIVAVNGVAP
jgi:hypothetical protein